MKSWFSSLIQGSSTSHLYCSQGFSNSPAVRINGQRQAETNFNLEWYVFGFTVIMLNLHRHYVHYSEAPGSVVTGDPVTLSKDL
jgi:hypothetical protein